MELGGLQGNNVDNNYKDMTSTTRSTLTLTTMKAKKDDGRDNGHKIIINCCDGDGRQCAMH
jgi:hypothetical protein